MLCLVAPFAPSALLLPSLPTRLPPARHSPPRLAVQLTSSDISAALSDEKYAMDISSITEGSEKETYIGQGSGVNEGTGIGALAAWSKSLVGKFLTWKNKPIYEELWNIIEDDLLKLVQEHEPALEQRRTWFSEPGSEPTSHTFTTADGKCEGTVAGYKGGKVDWITTCKFFSSELGFGNLRIDGWATRAPLPGSPGPRTGRPTRVDTYLFSSAPNCLQPIHACALRVCLPPHTPSPSPSRWTGQARRARRTWRCTFASSSTSSSSTSACHRAPTSSWTTRTTTTSTAPRAPASAVR